MKKLLCGCLCIVFLLSGSLVSCKQTDLPDTNDTNTATVFTPIEENSSDTETQTNPLPTLDPKAVAYATACNLLEEGKIEEAYDIFLTLKDFKDVSDYLDRFSFHYATEITYSPKSASTVYYEYDEHGNTTLYLYYSSSSNYKTSYIYTYDENDNLIQEIHQTPTSEDKIYTYEYNAENKLICQTDPDGNKITSEYDENGNKIKEINSYSQSTTEYQYDGNGNLIKEYLLFSDGATHIITYQYDTQGNMIKRTDQQTDGDEEVVEYEYDYRDNLIKETSLYATISRSYDANGNMTEYRYEHSNGSIFATYYEYNCANLCVKETFVQYRRTANTQTDYEYEYEYEYEYDSYGNLIKTIRNGETDSPDDYYITVYSGYRLYYNPQGFRPLPTYIGGKG